MAERFTRLYSFPENLYEDRGPVVIVAGNLLKDNQLHRVLAQLKIRNIDRLTIDEITLQFCILDAEGKVPEKAFTHKLDRLQLAENDFYGAKNPIQLPNSNATACRIKVSKVVFADGSEWNSSGVWEALGADRNVDDLKAARDRRQDEEKRQTELAEKSAEEQAAAKSARTTKIVAGIIAVAIIACVGWIIAVTMSNSKKAAEIRNNLDGKVFVATIESTTTSKKYDCDVYLSSESEITFFADGSFIESYTRTEVWEDSAKAKYSELKDSVSERQVTGTYDVEISVQGAIAIRMKKIYDDTTSFTYVYELRLDESNNPVSLHLIQGSTSLTPYQLIQPNS